MYHLNDDQNKWKLGIVTSNYDFLNKWKHPILCLNLIQIFNLHNLA